MITTGGWYIMPNRMPVNVSIYLITLVKCRLRDPRLGRALATREIVFLRDALHLEAGAHME